MPLNSFRPTRERQKAPFAVSIPEKYSASCRLTPRSANERHFPCQSKKGVSPIMKLNRTVGPLAAIVAVFAFANVLFAQSPTYRISAPYTYKNLSIFLIHGKNETSKTNIITLAEAMERKLFRVYETSDVNELMVENLSKELDVFI